jgi:hypothetical protein
MAPELFPQFAPGQSPAEQLTFKSPDLTRESVDLPGALRTWYHGHVPGANAPPLKPLHPEQYGIPRQQ